MRLIAAILVVALSGAAVCGQDFGGHALFVRTADADPGKKKCERILCRKRDRQKRERERGVTVVVVINMKLITNEWFKIH